jgi:hypothetical protein
MRNTFPGFLLFILTIQCSAQSDTLPPDRLSSTSLPGYYERVDKRSAHFEFKNDGRFSQSGWPKIGTWILSNDTIICTGMIPWYNIHRYTLGMDHINWKMIVVNGELFKLKRLLSGSEYRIPRGYLKKST